MNITARLRARHAQSRNRRAIARAIANAPSPAMRNELIAMAQRQMDAMR